MTATKIEWTDDTWNPLRGCSRVSAGCDHCYAEGIAARFSGPGLPYEGVAKMVHGKPHWTGKVMLDERKLLEPLHWRKPRRVFVNSMSDLFHEAVPDATLDRIFAVMALTPHITYQVLTKRPERMREYCAAVPEEGEGWVPGAGPMYRIDELLRGEMFGQLESGRWHEDIWERLENGIDGMDWPLGNVWLGVSCEDRPTAEQRIPLLLATPAAVRFVSLEPLLAAIDLHSIGGKRATAYRMIRGTPVRLDWVIVGGESGPGARPMHPDWARALRDQCQAAGVPFFMKQLSGPKGRAIKAIEQFPEDLRVREWPAAEAPRT